MGKPEKREIPCPKVTRQLWHDTRKYSQTCTLGKVLGSLKGFKRILAPTSNISSIIQTRNSGIFRRQAHVSSILLAHFPDKALGEDLGVKLLRLKFG